MIRNKKLLSGRGVIVVLAVLVAVLIGIYMNRQQTAEDNVIRIGAILPLTGPVSEDGKELLYGIKIAEEFMKMQNGKIGKFIVYIEDSKADGKLAVTAYNSLINRGIDALIIAGDTPCRAISPMLEKSKIPTIATMVSLDISELSEWIFGGWFYVPETAAVMAAYMRNVEKIDDASIFYDDTDEHGQASMLSFKNKFESLGGRIVGVESYPAIAVSVKSEMAKLLQHNPTNVFVTGFAHGMISSFNELAQMGFLGGIYSDNAASDNVVVSNISSPNGITFIDLDFDHSCEEIEEARFVRNHYQTITGRNRVSSQAVLAHHAVMVLINALQNTSSPAEVKKNILSIKNASTIIGSVSYRSDRKITFPLIVKKYTSLGEKVTVDTNIWRSVIGDEM